MSDVRPDPAPDSEAAKERALEEREAAREASRHRRGMAVFTLWRELVHEIVEEAAADAATLGPEDPKPYAEAFMAVGAVSEHARNLASAVGLEGSDFPFKRRRAAYGELEGGPMNAETFGAHAFKEMVAQQRKQNRILGRPKLDELLRAAEAAKNLDDAELADKLQARARALLAELEAEDAAPPGPLAADSPFVAGANPLLTAPASPAFEEA